MPRMIACVLSSSSPSVSRDEDDGMCLVFLSPSVSRGEDDGTCLVFLSPSVSRGEDDSMRSLVSITNSGIEF